jgi:hypothetical protein
MRDERKELKTYKKYINDFRQKITHLSSFDFVSNPGFSTATFLTKEELEKIRLEKIRKLRLKKLERILEIKS